MTSEELINTYKEQIESSIEWIKLNDIKPYGNEFITYMGDIKLAEGIMDIQLIGKHLENGIDYIGFQADFINPTTYDYKGNPTESRNVIGVCTAKIKDGEILESNFNELKNKLHTINYHINKEIKNEFKNICDKYDFKYKETSEGKISLCAKDTDKHWQKWIEVNLKEKNISITGNTDQCNFWFCDTRKDMNPTKIISFVASLNNLFRRLDTYVELKTIIDPEDWQEIAGVQDAYNDNLYNIDFNDIAFGEDNYIYFSIGYGEYSLDGLFRIHDPKNGPDMNLVSIDCNTEEDKEFVNAHWETIQEKLCDIAKQRQEQMEIDEASIE